MNVRPALTVAALALIASAALAASLDGGGTDARRIGPGSHWWITEQDCSIQGHWGSPEAEVTTLWITPITSDTYRFQIEDTHWRDIEGSMFDVGIGFDAAEPAPVGSASGLAGDGTQGFFVDVGADVVSGLLNHQQIDIYRDGTLLANLDLDRAREAVEALNGCAARLDLPSNVAMENISADSMMYEPMNSLDAMEMAVNAVEDSSLPQR